MTFQVGQEEYDHFLDHSISTCKLSKNTIECIREDEIARFCLVLWFFDFEIPVLWCNYQQTYSIATRVPIRKESVNVRETKIFVVPLIH